jgi:dihydropyrimidinase
MDLVIKNGVIVGPHSCYPADLGIEGGRIVQLAEKLEPGESTVLDAAGAFLLPGVVDLHTHFATSGADFEAGTRAAAAGGVTTVVDFAVQSAGKSLGEALDARKAQAAGHALADYAFHLTPVEWTEALRREIREAIGNGHPSFEFHLAAGCLPDVPALDDAALYELFQETAKLGGTVVVRPGNACLSALLTRQLARDRVPTVEHLQQLYPAEAEADGVRRAIALADLTDANLLLGPLSSRLAAAALADGRATGVNVAGETGTAYLLRELLTAPAERLGTRPPLRSPDDAEALWHAAVSGDIEVVSSGHRTCALDARLAGASDLARLEPGFSGVGLTLPLLFSEGVRRGRMTLSRLVQLLSTSPALLAGLFPAKGILQVGSDADIVVMDPEREWIVPAGGSGEDASPFAGLALRGAPRVTILRGQIVVEGEQWRAQPGVGQLARRRPLDEIY